MTEAVDYGLEPGLRVLISAGADGIGRVMAERFLAAKARVHVCDASPDALDRFRAALPAAGATLADVASVGDVDRLFADAKAAMGGLDVLVNNAGIAGPTARVDEISPEDWRRCLEVNINGHFYCTRLAVPLIRESSRGSIVNISSVAGRLGMPLRTPYSASKWAVVGFTKSLAKELGPVGIRVNAILPGPVEGARIRRVWTARAAARGLTEGEIEREELERVSLRRLVSPRDIAAMALFLCSPGARNVSGQAISVDGDLATL